MIINLALKFEWINEHWSQCDGQRAYEVVGEAMMKYQCEIYSQTLAQSRSATHTAAHAQNLGYLRVLSIGQTLRRASASSPESSKNGVDQSADGALAASNGLPPRAHVRLAPTPAEIHAHNVGAVQFELNQYIAKGTIPIESMGAIDLTEFWRAHQFTYPLLYRIAMDVLPVQASSVSSERVFSSSKMTCTAERNRLSVQTMEALQVLKHALKHRRRESSESEMKTLDFVSHVFESLELED